MTLLQQSRWLLPQFLFCIALAACGGEPIERPPMGAETVTVDVSDLLAEIPDGIHRKRDTEWQRYLETAANDPSRMRSQSPSTHAPRPIGSKAEVLGIASDAIAEGKARGVRPAGWVREVGDAMIEVG